MQDKYFNRSATLIVLFFLAFSLRMLHQVVFYDLGPDKMRQIPAAGNYARGNGITDCTVAVSNLTELTCQPQNWWAAGYPILTGWLYYFGVDFIVSDYILISLALLILFFSAFIIFQSIDQFRKNISPFFLFLLFSAFSFTPYHYLPTTDLLSLALFFAGCATSIYIIKGNYSIASVLAGLLFFLAGFFKYSYYPFLIALPLTLSLIFLFTRKKQLIYSIIVYSVTVLASFGLLWIFFPDHLINTWIADYSKGWNWHNLLQFDVFPVKAFFFVDPLMGRLENFYWLNLLVRAGMSVASFILVSSFFIYTFYRVKKTYLKGISDVEAYVYLLGSMMLLANVGYLIWISVRLVSLPQQNNPNWTFVWETRFYSPAILFIQIFLFSIPFKADFQIPKLKVFLKVLVITPVIFAFAYCSWKYFDVFVNKRLSGTYYAESVDKLKIANYLKENLPKETQPAVLTFVNYGEAYGARRLQWEDKQNKTSSLASFGEGATKLHWDFNESGELLRTTRPVSLFFLMPKELSDSETKFVGENSAVIVLSLSDSDLYRMQVNP